MYLLLASIATITICLITEMCALYIYNGGALWWAIYRMLIGYMGTFYDWLLMYNIYTMSDAYAYIPVIVIITILLLTKKIK